MFANMKLGTKIYLGFAVVILIFCIVTIVGWRGISGSSEGFTTYRTLARHTNLTGRLQANMLMARMNVKDFIITGSEKKLRQYKERLKTMEKFLSLSQKEITNKTRAEKINFVVTHVNKYKIGFDKVVTLKKRRNYLLHDILNQIGPKMERNLTNIMQSAEQDNDTSSAYLSGITLRNLLLGRMYVIKFLDTNGEREVKRVNSEFSNMRDNMQKLDKALKKPASRQLLTQIKKDKETYQNAFKNLVTTIYTRNTIIKKDLDVIGPQIADQVEQVKLGIKAEQDYMGPKLVAKNHKDVWLISMLGLIATVIGIFSAFFITSGITKPLNAAIDSLGQGADQVTAASGQVSASSMHLAEGASEQAAGLEETSSSLEEMSSMTKQNSENATLANTLMNQTNTIVLDAQKSMGDLGTAMSEISKASDDTSKIIKTIDEIAFQTNLLALNAAVEAARAGEAGAGFAVVADEVRNLAMRAADAARETAILIEDIVKKVGGGNVLLANSTETFTQVTESSTKVTQLVGEIAAASQEQSQGVSQISNAVMEMDKVVQENSASAEESASASEELNAQAETMRGIVLDLIALARGRNARDTTNHSSTQIKAANTNLKLPEATS
ncbi:Methyl-accepting chemotaxis protein I (serine chemoreceptor protein) [hydrothermal vent metagenome]|uniref:Methyl-accepting chemotaxis protein I (Serine chemoreceptor protein) n=1 Tax=hydrothermal vent metagenome TaxID=652676 RepID=A0A3B0VQC6_9ZZZZ